MRSRLFLGFATGLLTLTAMRVVAQDVNFPSRRALIVNNCPFIELSAFSFKNKYSNGGFRLEQDLTWKNVGTQPVVAFEIVVLKYDPFNRRLVGTRWTVPGRNSGDWSPLAVGESNADGTIGLNDEKVLTAIAYIRNARLADGTVWTADDVDLLRRLRQLSTGIPDFGDVKPDTPRP